MPADISSSLKDWSTTAASNAPSGSTAISTNLDDNLRELQKVVRAEVATNTTLASATTTDLGSVDAHTVNITGTTTITGLGTVSAGIRRKVWFSGALTLTHNGTSLILPTSANITTAAGDSAEFVSLGGGNWRCLWFQRADGNPLAVSQLTFADGSASSPAVRFTNDTDTGLYRVGANSVALGAGNAAGLLTVSSAAITAALGTTSLEFTTGGVLLDGPGTTARKIEVEGSTSAYTAGFYNDTSGLVSAKIINPANTQALTLQFTSASPSSGTNAVLISNSFGNLWRVDCAGSTFADGAYSSSGADYAEAFLYEGDKPEPGDTVALVGDKVRKADDFDEVIGVVSEKPAVVGDQKLLEAGGVPVGLIGKLRVNPGCPVNPRWKLLKDDLYLVV